MLFAAFDDTLDGPEEIVDRAFFWMLDVAKRIVFIVADGKAFEISDAEREERKKANDGNDESEIQLCEVSHPLALRWRAAVSTAER